MPDRDRLPPRRPSQTLRVLWVTPHAEHKFHVTLGHDPETGAVREVFFGDGMKSGTDLRFACEDACVLVSLLLQHGVAPRDIGKSLGRTHVYNAAQPASFVGAIVDALIRATEATDG